MKRVLAGIICITALSLPVSGCSFRLEVNNPDISEPTQALKQTTAQSAEQKTEQTAKVTEKAMEKTEKNTTAADAQKESTSSKKTENPAIKEMDALLDQIKTEVVEGDNKSYVRVASSLMNWGVGTPLTTEQIKKETASFYAGLGSGEKAAFVKNVNAVYDTYKKLLGSGGAENLLAEAGVKNAAYPWSTEPLETVEAVYEVVTGTGR
ncbi:MAG: hypothetical protein PUE71_08880 [Clostridia bacterium]|nr:hypothetical protein [Clostridia bacterium]